MSPPERMSKCKSADVYGTSVRFVEAGFEATAIVSEREFARLMKLDCDARCRVVEQCCDSDRVIDGHGTIHDAFQKVFWRSGSAEDQSRRYGDLLVDMMAVPVGGVASVENAPTQDTDNGGMFSLEMAVAASPAALCE